MNINEMLERLNKIETPKKYSVFSIIYKNYKFLNNDSVLLKYDNKFYIYRNKGSARMLIDLDDRKVYIGIPAILARGLNFKFVMLPYSFEYSRKKLNTILLNTTFIEEEAEPIDVVSEFGLIMHDMGRGTVFEYDVTKRVEEIHDKYSRPDSVDVKTKVVNIRGHTKEIDIVTLKYGNEEIKLTYVARNILGLSNSELITYSMVCEKLYSSSACSTAVRRNIFKTLYELRDYGLIDKHYALTTVKGFAVYHSSTKVESNEKS